MTFTRYTAIAAITLSLAAAQSRETFKARLSAVPADARTRAELAGSGAATAVLEGSKLSVTGSFEGLRTAATMAQLHNAVAAGVRGPKGHQRNHHRVRRSQSRATQEPAQRRALHRDS
jgi:hypothetical protein